MMRVHSSVDFQALRLYVLQRWPYYLHALLTIVPVAVDREIHGWLVLDKRLRLYYNPDQISRLMSRQDGREALAFRLVHLINHWLRKHSARLGLYVPFHGKLVVELASEMEINDDLRKEVNLPKWMRVVYPETFGLPPGLLAEEYISRLEKMLPIEEIHFPGESEASEESPGEEERESYGERQAEGDVSEEAGSERGEAKEPAGKGLPGMGCGSCVHGVETEIEKEANAQGIEGADEMSEHLARRRTARAIYEHYRSRGYVPAGLLRLIEDIVHPRVDWRLELVSAFSGMLSPHSGSFRTYQRPSRRQSALERVAGKGLLFPSRYSKKPKVAVVLDTSASMDDAKLGLAKGAVAEILKAYGSYVIVICTDAQAYDAQRVFMPQEIQLIGGGGTEISRGIEKACSLDDKPDVIVVITDGMTDWMEQPPPIPVMVLLLGDEGSAPDWAKHVVRISELDIRRLTS